MMHDVRNQAPMVNYEVKENFIKTMCLTYQNMIATEKLLELCAVIPGELQRYFAHHLNEERSHADWLRGDIESLGAKPESLRVIPEMAQMVGAQYYYINHVDCCTMLGYMAVLEGNPATQTMAERLKELYGSGAYTMAYHAKHDVKHAEELFAAMDLVPERLHWLVFQSAKQTAELYRDAMWRLFIEE